MNVGELRTPVTIRQKTIVGVDSEFGTDIVDWMDYVTLRMKAMIGNGREFYGAKKINSELTGILKGRWYPGITSEMKAVVNGKEYDITAVINIDERFREMELHVKAVTI